MKDDKLAALPPQAAQQKPPQRQVDAREQALAKDEATGPARSAVSSRAMASPRTDADAGAPAPPPSAALAPPSGGTLAQRKAAPATEGSAFTRDQSKLENFTFNKAAGATTRAAAW
jgi:hypothetical protein